MTTCRFPFIVLLSFIIAGCANITTPNGGRRDRTPPKLLSVTPADSLLNTRPERIELGFDEYVTVSDVSKEVQVSPILPIAPAVLSKNKHVTVKFIDSLLENNTTYRVSFGNAIKDIHEGNAFSRYTYTFSTGAYFDSLQLQGIVINALTGLNDSNGMTVELYNGSEDDTCVVRKKPKYITKVGAGGKFVFKGLPGRRFKVYALKDVNNNMTYDGPVPGEWVGFADIDHVAGDTMPILLSVFPEAPDTVGQRKIDSLEKKKMSKMRANPKDTLFTFNVNIDTTNKEKRSFDITGPIKVLFNRQPVPDVKEINLVYENGEDLTDVPVTTEVNARNPKELIIKNKWLENTVYTISFSKDFAHDTSGKSASPAKYTFRTNSDDDYGKMKINLPGKYNSTKYLLLVSSEKDTINYKPVTDTIVKLSRIKPGKYTLRIIADANGNGTWDTGDLLAKRQPEVIIPGPEPTDVKQGFEYVIDFEPKPKPKMTDKKEKKDTNKK